MGFYDYLPVVDAYGHILLYHIDISAQYKAETEGITV